MGDAGQACPEPVSSLRFPARLSLESRKRRRYGPSSAIDRKLRAGNGLAGLARSAVSSTSSPSPGPVGRAIYPSTGLSTFGHRRWLISSNGRKYSVMMKFGMQAAACTVADSDRRRGIIVMRRHRDHFRFRRGCDIHQFENAAAIGNVRIDDIGSAGAEDRPESGARIERLAGDDRNLAPLPHLRERLDIRRLARLLEPVGLEFGKRIGEIDGVHRRQPAMDVEQQDPHSGRRRRAWPASP